MKLVETELSEQSKEIECLTLYFREQWLKDNLDSEEGCLPHFAQ
jgi:hypothetical protein